jgi:CcmD family protein
MKKNAFSLLLVLVALALAICFWRWDQVGLGQMDASARLNHEFTVAAYAVTWLIQLGYLALLGRKWRSMKRRHDR